MTTALLRSNLIIHLFVIIFGLTGNALCQASKQTDITQLRRAFIEATDNDFEFVKDMVETGSKLRGISGRYWLVHVKPKRSGHYALKYTYKYHDKFYEAGENTLYIRAGGNPCYRYPLPGMGVSSVCLGDTVIIPIRIQYFSDHAFSVKYTHEAPQSIEEGQKISKRFLQISNAEPLKHPLEKHLKYLGTHCAEMLHRNGGSTIVYSAFFEAQSAGRFNINLSSDFGQETSSSSTGISSAGSIPIIIVNPGTPITALLWKEDTITYADNRRFSSHSGNNFLINLLLLQPGDVISLEYSKLIQRKEFKKTDNDALNNPIQNRHPIIHKFPFSLQDDWGFNDWILDYLPPAN